MVGVIGSLFNSQMIPLEPQWAQVAVMILLSASLFSDNIIIKRSYKISKTKGIFQCRGEPPLALSVFGLL